VQPRNEFERAEITEGLAVEFPRHVFLLDIPHGREVSIAVVLIKSAELLYGFVHARVIYDFGQRVVRNCSRGGHG
jgi:hypothetical protein